MFAYLTLTEPNGKVTRVPNPALSPLREYLKAVVPPLCDGAHDDDLVGIDRYTGRPATIYTPPEDIIRVAER